MFLIFNGENGKTVKINIENIIQRFSDDIGFDVKSAGIMLDKKDSSICAWSDDLHEEKSDYPGIWVTGTYSMHNLDISRTELPNADNETVTTYLYAGRTGQETDDWLLSVHDGERDSEDDIKKRIEKETCGVNSSGGWAKNVGKRGYDFSWRIVRLFNDGRLIHIEQEMNEPKEG